MQIKQNIISNKRRKLVMYWDNKGHLVDVYLRYIHGVNLDINNNKTIKREIWYKLHEAAKINLLCDDFFPYMGVEKVLYDNLPQKAREVFDKNDFFVVSGGSYPGIMSRSFENEIEDTIWQGLTPESRQTLLNSNILPVNGVRKVEWDALPPKVKKMLLDGGCYPI